MSELLIEGATVVTMDPKGTILADGAVAVRDDRIEAVGPTSELTGKYPDYVKVNASGKAVLPGLINIHGHMPWSAGRGLTEDVNDGYWAIASPINDHFTSEAAEALSRLSCAELLKAGCTTINDAWDFADRVAVAVEDMGLRACMNYRIRGVKLGEVRNRRHIFTPDEGGRIQRSVDFIEKWNGRAPGRITCSVAPMAPNLLSLEGLKEVRKIADRYGVLIHTHVSQTRTEVDYIRETYGKGSFELLDELGLLGEHLIAAHFPFVQENEIDLIEATDTALAHCPVIMSKRGTFPPMDEIYRRKIRVGLGTDNFNLDPWDNLRFAICAVRLQAERADVMTSERALRMLTIDAAKILRLGDKVGSIETGKKADITIIDMRRPGLSPFHKDYVLPTIVYNACSGDVDTVMVDGKILLEGGELKVGDEREIIREAQSAAEAVWKAAGIL
jgi:5-methylthioadenosine/S-adenosylhomocysteine deaminase